MIRLMIILLMMFLMVFPIQGYLFRFAIHPFFKSISVFTHFPSFKPDFVCLQAVSEHVS